MELNPCLFYNHQGSRNKINYNLNLKSSNLLRIGSLNFHKTMDLFQWGQVHFILEDSEAIYIKVNPELDTSSSL